MKKLLLASAAMFIGGSAFAADMGVPYYKAAAPIPPSPAWSWTGIYVGANGGSGWGNDDQNVHVGAFGQKQERTLYDQPQTLSRVGGGGFAFPGVGFDLSSIGVDGFLAGGQIGANYQIGFVVVGVESSFDWANLHGTAPCVVVVSCHTNIPWLGDVTGRAGVAVDKALIYVKGGVAFARADYTDTVNLNPLVPFSATATGSETRVGAVLGAGVEYAFLPNWSAKIEYDFYDFGSTDSPLALTTNLHLPSVVPLTVDNDERFHVIKFGVNYKLF